MMLKRILSILLILTTLCTVASAQRLDSIARLLPNANDSLKQRYLDTLAYEYENLDSIMKYSEQLLALAEKYNNDYYKFNALIYKGYVFYYRDQMEDALNCYYRMLDIAEKENDHKKKGTSYRKIATVYSQLGNYNQSDNYYTKAVNEFKIVGDSTKIASVLRYQGYTYIDFNVFGMGKSNFKEAYLIDSARRDTSHIVEDLFNIGRAQYQESLYLSSDSLLECAKMTLIQAYFLDINKISSTMKTHILKYMVNIFTDKAFNAIGSPKQKIYADSLHFFMYLLDDKRKALGFNNVEDFSICEAAHKALNGNTGSAIKMLDSINVCFGSDAKKYNTSYTDLCHTYILIYKNIGDYKNVLKYTNLLLDYERNKRGQDFLVSASINKYEEELNERRANEKLLELRVSDQKKITAILIISIVTAVLLLIIIGMALARNRRNSRKLAAQNTEIANQRDLLESANKNSMAALVYANRIQSAALPSGDILERSFSDYFVILKPLNIVSGDFYWAAARRNLTFAAVGDCTGHGVPGAFLSMLSIASLNDIILSIQYEEISAAAILNALRNKIIESLHQSKDNNSSNDGLDIALVIYDNVSHSMQYSGAHRPLWIIHNGNITEIKGDRIPVGFYPIAKDFNNHIVEIHSGDTLCMFSDGVTDQINNPDERSKYSALRLKKVLLESSNLSLAEQKKILEDDFTKWRTLPDGTMEPQLDDQIIMAIKI